MYASAMFGAVRRNQAVKKELKNGWRNGRPLYGKGGGVCMIGKGRAYGEVTS